MISRNTLVLVLCLPLLASGWLTAREPGDGGKVEWSEWVSVGPGGGGHQRYPAISPHDTQLYFAACDMGGFYRSTDRGTTWRMICGINHVTGPAIFHPTDPNVVYVFNTYGGEFSSGWRLNRSTDKGRTWQVLHEYLGGYGANQGQCLLIAPDDPDFLIAGMTGYHGGGRIMLSRNGGNFWAAARQDVPDGSTPLGFVVDYSSPAGKRRILAATTGGIYESLDKGSTWTRLKNQPDQGELTCFAECRNTDTGEQLLFVLTPKGKGGILKSADLGKTWQILTPNVVAAARPGKSPYEFKALGVNNVKPDIVYVSCIMNGEPYRSGTYKSTDGGLSWIYCLPGDANHELVHGPKRGEGSTVETGWMTRDTHFSYGWGGPATYLTACASDPDLVIRTDDGRTLGTQDGGKTWQQLYTDHAEGNRWSSRGMEVTTCYNVYFDPKNHDRMYIAYTDIGFFRSEDRGKSWTFSLDGARHRNTIYELAIDPEDTRILYGANSGWHDIPEFKMIKGDETSFKGGVAKSTDGGLSWTMMGEGKGLPQGACTSILVEPQGTAAARTVYAAVFGYGLYKSADAGVTWELRNKGMDYHAINPNVWRITRGADGILYAAISKNITRTQRPDGTWKYEFFGGAVYRSEDQAETWTRVGLSMPKEPSGQVNEFANIWDICASPVQPGLVYAAVQEDRHCGPTVEGGLFKSTDKGATWKRVFYNEEVCRVSLHPSNPDVIYVGTFKQGLFGSHDGGISWNYMKGLPFQAVKKVAVDPDFPEIIWVSTFGGGVWRGPAVGDRPARFPDPERTGTQP